MPVSGENDCESNGGFCGCDADGENCEHDPRKSLGMRAEAPEGDEVQVGSVEHEFDPDEDEDRVTAGQGAR